MENPVWDSRAPTEQHDNSSPRPIEDQRWPKIVTEDNCDEVFEFLEQYRVLVCKQHYTGVVNLDKHLREQHKTPIIQRKEVIEYFSHFSRADPSTIKLPAQPVKAIQQLGTPLDGLKCSACSYISINTDEIRKHCKKDHDLSWTSDKSTLFQSVKVQTLFSGRSLRKYFIVNLGVEDNSENHHRASIIEQQLTSYKLLRQQLQNADELVGETAKTDKTLWFKRTEWPEHFKGRNLVYLAHQIRLPDRDEHKLQLVAELTEQLVENCVKNLATLPREIRRWLRSAKQHEVDVRPLARLQNPESQAKYASYMVKFVCYYLRIIADEDRVEDDNSEAASSLDSDASGSEFEEEEESSEGSVAPQRRLLPAKRADLMKDAREMFPWKDNQRILAGRLWFALDDGDRSIPMAALLDSLSSFILTGTRGIVFSSGLLHFLGVLGIDPEMRRFHTARNYSYMLAGVVYCTRVIGVAKLLPATQRDSCTDEMYDEFLEMRRKYLADGSLSPMSEMLSLLAYGKHIAHNQGNTGNACWSPDKKVFFLNGRPIIIERFREMAQRSIEDLSAQLWQLLWVQRVEDRVAVDLAQVLDDMSFTKRGTCFVTKPGNRLTHGLEWMLQRARSEESGLQLQTIDGRWKVKRVRQYLRQVDRFLELLLFCVHVTSGQPGRGSEITTIRHRNGLLQDRNVYVIDGRIMTVVRYHKSQSQFDTPKIVPRFLPPQLGQIMAIHLVYLQPFQEYLTVMALGGGLSDYVWSDKNGPWSTERLTKVIRRETSTRLGVELHTLGYRHAAVGIGRVKVSESFSKGYQDDVGEGEEAEVDEDQEDPIELQNSRTTAMGIGNYSVPMDIVKHLSVRSIDVFRELSTAWHRFLGVDGQYPQLVEQIGLGRVTKRRMRESMSGLVMLPKEKEARIAEPRNDGIQRALQRVLGKQDVGFRSMEQEKALLAVLDKQTPLVVVLPTGGGKSLLFTLPACIEETGVTVVVVPFRALIEDLVDRIQRCGVECMEWKYGETDAASVVVVSADVAGDITSNGNFIGYARQLKDKGLLQRVVVDECHLVFTSRHWRDKLLRVKNLRLLGCPLVLLTATLPPLREVDLESSMLLRHVTYIRASTVRPNARYFVSQCERGKLEETALAMCRRWAERLRRSKQKGVVYCKSKAQCEMIAQELECAHYHAEVVDRADRLQEWVEKGGMIVATSALGTGVDFAGIVYILHVGMPWSMTDFAQASGRGGRGGELFDVVVVVERGEVERTMEQEGEDIDVLAMGQMLIGAGCRRALMSSYLDEKGVSCREIEAAGCDRCGEGEDVWVEAQEGWGREWGRVEAMFNELRSGCGICWVLEQQTEQELEQEVGEEVEEQEVERVVQWREHRTMGCTRFSLTTGAQADKFRRMMVDRTTKNNCRRCWVSQKYCATGEGVENKCQWPNVVVPLAFAARATDEGRDIIERAGFQEEGDEAYARWLGRRHREEIWGEIFTNAMVVAIRLVLGVFEGGSKGDREEE